MVACKMSLCCLSFVALMAMCSAVQSQHPSPADHPRVVIERQQNMSASMQLDAVDCLKRAFMSTSGNSCGTFRLLFQEKYPQHTWHVVLYEAYSVQYVKGIDLKIDNDHYLLFAT